MLTLNVLVPNGIFLNILRNKCLRVRNADGLKVAPYSYNVSVHVLFEGLLLLFRESCGVET